MNRYNEKLMGYVIEKHIVKKYDVMEIWKFLKFSVFCDARKKLGNTPKTCFKCGHEFSEDEYIYLGVVKNDKNRIFCETCANEIAKELGEDEVRSVKF